MKPGEIIRFKKLDTFPRPPAPGSKPLYVVDRATYQIDKGNVYVAVLLGAEKLDGSNPIDTDALIAKLAKVQPVGPAGSAGRTPPQSGSGIPLLLQPGDRDPTTLQLLEKLKRYEEALASIRRLPEQFGHFNGADAATEAIRIAKEALL